MPARLWEHGARCFVGQFIVKALDEAAAFVLAMTRSYLVGDGQLNRLRCTCSGQPLFLHSGWFESTMPSRTV